MRSRLLSNAEIVTGGLFPKAARRKHEEDAFQKAVMQFLKAELPADAKAWHCPNGGQRHSKAAARLSGLGVVAGMPDVHILWRGRMIFFELKTPDGVVSAVQRQMMERLAYCGGQVFVARCREHIVDRLRECGVPLDERHVALWLAGYYDRA
jgi:hypothetical protein